MLKWQLLKPLFGNYISAGLLYISAQISPSVTSVNNGNKERACRRVPPRQSTCHQVARPVPSTPPSFPSCCWPFAGAQITRRSTMGSGESGWWSWWRSGLAPFNTASTSNNSRLWQLCIIHLVESLSLSLPFLLDAPLCLSSFSFSSVLLFILCLPALWEGERENQCSVPSDAACFPPDTSDFRDTEVFVCSTLPRLREFWMPSEPDCVTFLTEAQWLNPWLQHGAGELLPERARQSQSRWSSLC